MNDIDSNWPLTDTSTHLPVYCTRHGFSTARSALGFELRAAFGHCSWAFLGDTDTKLWATFSGDVFGSVAPAFHNMGCVYPALHFSTYNTDSTSPFSGSRGAEGTVARLALHGSSPQRRRRSPGHCCRTWFFSKHVIFNKSLLTRSGWNTRFGRNFRRFFFFFFLNEQAPLIKSAYIKTRPAEFNFRKTLHFN